MTIERTAAGHRVLRLLAQGDRSQVWLAANDVVLKVLDAARATEVGREAEALHRARGDHAVELLDVSLGADGAVLVFPRLTRGSLAELLWRRHELDAGEAVTILAPIAACLARMHTAGVAHCSVSPASVLFRADGAPMLTGFGRAELFGAGRPEVELERVPGVVADRTALMNLADTVLTRATGERGTVATRLRAAFRAMDTGVFAERVSGELFELAAARPVRFDADEPDAGRGRVGRAVAVTDPVPEETDDLASGSLRQSWGLVSGLLDSGPGSLLRSALKKRWATWSVGRRRAMIAAGAAGLALVVLFAAVPGPRPSSAPPVTQNPEAEAPAAAQQDPDLDIGGDDPLVALEQLASRRDGCFRELSVLCLDGVDETGSGAWQIDRAALQAILAGGDAPRRLNVSSAQLVERLGDSALIDLGSNSDPASVLLLKGEAGWRIRDYLAPIGAEVAQGD